MANNSIIHNWIQYARTIESVAAIGYQIGKLAVAGMRQHNNYNKLSYNSMRHKQSISNRRSMGSADKRVTTYNSATNNNNGNNKIKSCCAWWPCLLDCLALPVGRRVIGRKNSLNNKAKELKRKIVQCNWPAPSDNNLPFYATTTKWAATTKWATRKKVRGNKKISSYNKTRSNNKIRSNKNISSNC